MFCLNFSNLDRETQQLILTISKAALEQKFKQKLLAYAQKNKLPYEQVLEEEAIRNLYNFEFQFSV